MGKTLSPDLTPTKTIKPPSYTSISTPRIFPQEEKNPQYNYEEILSAVVKKNNGKLKDAENKEITVSVVDTNEKDKISKSYKSPDYKIGYGEMYIYVTKKLEPCVILKKDPNSRVEISNDMFNKAMKNIKTALEKSKNGTVLQTV